jgi:hypothetical protein
MKRFLYTVLILLPLFAKTVFAQPVINERFFIDEATYSIFSSVFVTDSCYFVGSVQSSDVGLSTIESSLIKFNFDGIIEESETLQNDTVGIGFWYTTELIQTLDNNFSTITLSHSTTGIQTIAFIKLNSFGDTINTEYFPQFYLEDLNEARAPKSLFQDSDSTYFGVFEMQHSENFLIGFTFFRLDKNGNLLYKKNFYGDSPSGFNALTSASMIKTGENELMIGCAYRKDYGDTEDKRHHTRLYKIDTLGEVLETHTNLVDTFNLDCNSLTKTSDGGYLYCGRVGRYYPEPNSIDYRMHVVKLNADYSVDWKLPFGVFTSGFITNLSKILPLNETEFVVTGYYPADEFGVMGCLLKFNIVGELIWHRKYRKITKWGGGGEHYLYDVERTPDDGFVMVGQAIDNLGYSDLPGQKAWLVKTDEYGCIVPGCEDDDVGIAEGTDVVRSRVYPNPAQNTLFYYHHQDAFEPVTIAIYSINGQQVHEWQLNTNNVTCEVDIDYFEPGVYVLRATNLAGKVLATEKFVKE